MIVEHYISGLSEKAGGSSRAVVQMCDALANNLDISIGLTAQTSQFETNILPVNKDVIMNLITPKNTISRIVGFDVIKHYSCIVNERRPDIFHLHGIWDLSTYAVYRFAKKNSIPVVIQPHGMLEPWAMGWRRVKKHLAMQIYQKRSLCQANLIVATAVCEAENISKLGIETTKVVIPNGLDKHSRSSRVIARKKLRSFPRKALFLSRIHPKKGLKNLIEAWKNISPKEWVLYIAGPDEDGHQATIQNLIKKHSLEESIIILGNLSDNQKWPVYEECDLFVLPSFSENFALVVVEALSAGLPVITTTGTPWGELSERGCGWWVSPTVRSIEQALTEAFLKSENEFDSMSTAARNYSIDFCWDTLSKDLVSAYTKLVNDI